MSRQRREDAILGVRAGLRITRTVFADHLEAHPSPIGRKGRARRGRDAFPQPDARIGRRLWRAPSEDRFEQKGRFQNERRRGAREDGRLRAETVLFHLAPERDGADLEGVGGLAPIAAKPLERALDTGAFLSVKIEAIVGRAGAGLL
jgi:hypothetical protein